MSEQNSDSLNASSSTPTNESNSANEIEDTAADTSSAQGQSEQIKQREENPFSLKHFLNKNSESSTSTTSSSSSSPATNLNNEQNKKANGGARPKIPFNNSYNSIQQTSSTGLDTAKMKRSPKFSSFDSQASLASSLPNNHHADTLSSLSNVYQSTNNSMFSYTNDVVNVHRPQRSCSTYDLERRNRVNYDNDLLGNTAVPNRSGLAGDISSALPDFVQDHLLCEQLLPNLVNEYRQHNLNGHHPAGESSTHSEYNSNHINYENLPDFANNDELSNFRATTSSNPNPTQNGDMPFDLMCNSNDTNNDHRRLNISLDLPINSVDIPMDLLAQPPPQQQLQNGPANFPLDLTARNDSGSMQSNGISNTRPSFLSTADKFQTLPDFLSDGHVHSTSTRQSDVNLETSPDDSSDSASTRAIMESLRFENSRLRLELRSHNDLINLQTNKITDLESNIDQIKNSCKRKPLDISNLDKVGQYLIEANDPASALIIELRNSIKQLTFEIEALRQENEILKEGGAVGGSSSSSTLNSRSAYNLMNRQPPNNSTDLSNELMLAASNAEASLRTLLSGVENLRLLARRIETHNDDTTTTKKDDDFSDCEDEDFFGPAL